MTQDEQKELLNNAYQVKGEATTVIEIQQNRIREANQVIQNIMNTKIEAPEVEEENGG